MLFNVFHDSFVSCEISFIKFVKFTVSLIVHSFLI